MSVSPRPRAVVITGASTGIGAACALELARRGFQVFAGVRSEADAARLAAAGGEHIVPLRLDVTRDNEIAAAAATVAQAVGSAGLAGLVNNAGVCVGGPLELLPVTEIRRQLEINVVGVIAVTQAFLPLLRVAAGRIVNVGSISGRIAPPYLAPYAASKHALEAISAAWRLELRAWRIHVALLEPGSVATPIWDKSVAAADALAAQAGPSATDLYAADLDAVRRAVEATAAHAMPVETVVRAVLHALSARRPKARYPLGRSTWLRFHLIKWIPDLLWDRFMVKAMKLPPTGDRR